MGASTVLRLAQQQRELTGDRTNVPPVGRDEDLVEVVVCQ